MGHNENLEKRYSRFLYNKEHSRKPVHSKCFKPRKGKDSQKESVSCFETQGLDKNLVYSEIVKKNEIQSNGKYPTGYCSLMESKFEFDDIYIVHDHIPERHVSIVGWEKCNEERKDFLMQSLAKAFSDEIEVF